MSRLEQNDTRETIAIRLSEELKQEYRETIDESMSSDLRDYIKTIVETSDSNLNTSSQRLRQAHSLLIELTEEYDSDILQTDLVESRLSSHLNISKGAVKQGILHDLEERHLIRPLWGRVKVYEEPHTPRIGEDQ